MLKALLAVVACVLVLLVGLPIPLVTAADPPKTLVAAFPDKVGRIENFNTPPGNYALPSDGFVYRVAGDGAFLLPGSKKEGRALFRLAPLVPRQSYKLTFKDYHVVKPSFMDKGELTVAYEAANIDDATDKGYFYFGLNYLKENGLTIPFYGVYYSSDPPKNMLDVTAVAKATRD